MMEKKIPDNIPEELKSYLAYLEGRIQSLEDKASEPERTAKKVAEKQKPLWGNV